MILVLGASGNIGKATVEALLKQGTEFTGGYRRPEEAVTAQQKGIRTVLVDYADAHSLRAACAGMRRIFFVSAAHPDLVQWERNVLDAAQEAGVELLVKSSVWGAHADDFILAHLHRESERAIEASGVPYAFVSPNGFFQNLSSVAPTIQTQGVFPVPVGDAPVSEIDVTDIGRTVATILTTNGHAGKRYTIGGPEAITTEQKAAQVSELLGRPVRMVEVPAEDWKAMAMGAGVPERLADGLIDLQRYYIAGKASAVLPTVAELTGTAPRTFAEFLSENRAALIA